MREYRAGTLAAKCVYISDTARHTRAIKAPPSILYGTHAREGGKNKKIHARAIKKGAHESAKQKSAQKYFGVKRKYANDASDNQERTHVQSNE